MSKDYEKLKRKFWEDLLQKRIIYLEGDVNHEMAMAIGKEIVWLNALDEDTIKLYIDSPGGNVDAGLDIYDIIKHSKAPVTGIVYRRANSMAAVILQACAVRKAMQNARISIHSITIELKTVEEVENDPEGVFKKSKENQRKIYNIFLKKSSATMEEIKDMCKKGKTLKADEALELGLIDEII